MSNQTAIQSKQTRQMFAASNMSLATSTTLALILAFMQWDVVDHSVVAAWLSMIVLVALARSALVIIYQRAPASKDSDTHRWLKRFRLGVLAGGISWGIAGFVLFPANFPQQQMFLIFMMTGLTAGGVISYSADLFSGIVFSISILLPLIARLIIDGANLSIAMAMAAMLYLGFMIMSLRHINKNICENMSLNIEAVAREAVVRASEERYRLLLTHSPVGIFHYDTDFIITYCNDRFADILHNSAERITGLDMKALRDKAILPSLRKALEGEKGYYEGPYNATYSDAKGIVSMTSAPSFNDRNEIVGGIAIVEDISARHHMEETLQQQLQFTDALNRIARSVVEHDDSDAIFADTIRIVGQVLEADRALIYDISFDKQQAIALCEWLNPLHPDITPTRATYPLTAFIGGTTHMQRTRQALASHSDAVNPHLVEDSSGEVLHHQMMIQSLLWYPFAFHGNNYYLLVLNQIYSHRIWTKAETDFLDSVSQQLSVALEKIRLMNERQQTENDLRIAATAFESQEGILITDAHSNILRVNSAFTQITGFSGKEIVGKNPRMLSSGRQDAEFFRKMWAQLHLNGTWVGEIWNRRKSGEIYPEHLTITAVKDADGIITNYVATFNDITASKAAENEIKNLAFYDPLTNLPNRRLLMDRLNHAIASGARSGRSGALLFIDLDNFKTLNDTLGHDIGDLLLQQVSERLVSCIREGDTVARLGGDEFVVLLEDMSSQALEAAEQTESVGEKILATLNLPYLLASHDCRSTPSIGATLFNGHERPVEELMKQADIAMYQSKKAGRNTLRFFDPMMQHTINARAALEGELRKALDSRQFHLYYQIQVDNLRTPRGAESLIRWIHPQRGMISPAQFIPLAEETGLILPIGLWVLETACAQIKTWQNAALTRDLILSVNVSARQFRQANFVAQVQEVIQRYGINPDGLKLELTESLLLENVEDTITTMSALRDLGVRFSLDDFGTGYSSLQYLKRLPLDQLKIDQSFVRDITFDVSDRAIVRTIIAMAHSLNLDVIAEGVETEEQRQLLLDIGCAHFQGYLFGRPIPIEQFEVLLPQR